MIQIATVPTLRRFASFTRLALSNLAAQLSEQIALVAIPLIAVIAFDAGATTTGVIQMLNTLPFLLFAIPFGLLADRRSPALIMLIGESVRTASLAALVLLAVTGNATILLLAILGMTGSVGTVAYSIGAPTMVPSLVEGAGLARANGQIELCRSLAFAAGPALGGALVGLTGPELAFLLAISLSSAALVLVTTLPRVNAVAASAARPMQQVMEGASFVRHHDYLRPIVLTAVLFNTAWFCLQGVYVAYAIGRLDLTPGQTGLTLALYGVGMIEGTRIAGLLARRLPFGVSIVTGPVFGAGASLLLLATLAAPSFLIPSLAFFMLGMGPVIWTISTTTLRQVVTPASMLGRVTALIVTGTSGFRPIGAGIGALAFTLGGYELALGLSSLGFLAQAVVILRSPAARLATVPRSGDLPTAS